MPCVCADRWHLSHSCWMYSTCGTALLSHLRHSCSHVSVLSDYTSHTAPRGCVHRFAMNCFVMCDDRGTCTTGSRQRGTSGCMTGRHTSAAQKNQAAPHRLPNSASPPADCRKLHLIRGRAVPSRQKNVHERKTRHCDMVHGASRRRP